MKGFNTPKHSDFAQISTVSHSCPIIGSDTNIYQHNNILQAGTKCPYMEESC